MSSVATDHPAGALPAGWVADPSLAGRPARATFSGGDFQVHVYGGSQAGATAKARAIDTHAIQGNVDYARRALAAADGDQVPVDPAEMTSAAAHALGSVTKWIAASAVPPTPASGGLSINDYGDDHPFSPTRFLCVAQRADMPSLSLMEHGATLEEAALKLAVAVQAAAGVRLEGRVAA